MQRLHSDSAAWPCLVLALFGASLTLTAQGRRRRLPGRTRRSNFAIKRQWLTDLRAQKTFLPKFRITMTDRSAVHDSPDDCEMHLAGTLTDTVFGDPQPVVVEPPNLCKFKPCSTTPVTGTTSTKALWATKIDNTVLKKDCAVEGFPRVHTEHATGGGLGASNPRHVFEIHPATEIVCGSTDLPFVKLFRSFPDVRHISAASAHTCITQLKMWVRYHNEDAEDQYEFFQDRPANCGNFVIVEVSSVPQEWIQATGGGQTAIGRVTANGNACATSWCVATTPPPPSAATSRSLTRFASTWVRASIASRPPSSDATTCSCSRSAVWRSGRWPPRSARYGSSAGTS
jgi:hypothetical protein